MLEEHRLRCFLNLPHDMRQVLGGGITIRLRGDLEVCWGIRQFGRTRQCRRRKTGEPESVVLCAISSISHVPTYRASRRGRKTRRVEDKGRNQRQQDGGWPPDLTIVKLVRGDVFELTNTGIDEPSAPPSVGDRSICHTGFALFLPVATQPTKRTIHKPSRGVSQSLLLLPSPEHLGPKQACPWMDHAA